MIHQELLETGENRPAVMAVDEPILGGLMKFWTCTSVIRGQPEQTLCSERVERGRP